MQVTEGTPVLTNSYTLTPVPGAILHARGVPVLGPWPSAPTIVLFLAVECSEESFQIDLESLKEQQAATGARHLLLCYMRGKLPDMEGILKFCRWRKWWRLLDGGRHGVRIYKSGITGTETSPWWKIVLMCSAQSGAAKPLVPMGFLDATAPRPTSWSTGQKTRKSWGYNIFPVHNVHFG